MEAHEAYERFEHTHHHAAEDNGGGVPFASQAALVVAVLAAFLAVATFKANEVVKDAIQEQTQLSDTHFETQTQISRQVELQLNNAVLNAISITTAPAARKELEQAAETLGNTSDKLDPVIKELEKTAGEQQRSVKHNNNQHLLYELAVVGLQIGIVLASVSIIVRRRWLLYGGGIAGLVGVGVLIVGFAS
jgi:type II secretory pathway component PulF